MAQEVAQAMPPAPLPAGPLKDRPDGLLEAQRGIADDQQDPGETSLQQAPEQRGLERGVLTPAQVEASTSRSPVFRTPIATPRAMRSTRSPSRTFPHWASNHT